MAVAHESRTRTRRRRAHRRPRPTSADGFTMGSSGQWASRVMSTGPSASRPCTRSTSTTTATPRRSGSMHCSRSGLLSNTTSRTCGSPSTRPAPLDLQARAGGRVAVEEAEPARFAGGHATRPPSGSRIQRASWSSLYTWVVPAQRQLGLPVAVDVGGDDRGAVVEGAVDRVRNRAVEGDLGGGQRRTGRERLLEPGDLPVAVELEHQHGGAEHRPGRQRRRDRRHVAVDDRIRPRRHRQHRLHPSDRCE